MPGPSTLICTLGLLPENVSATSCEIGCTVEEPDTETEPLRSPAPAEPPELELELEPHAAVTIAMAVTPAAIASLRDMRILGSPPASLFSPSASAARLETAGVTPWDAR